ncbi:Fur family transcriptional regulator [Segatella bryantii]|uniref:Fur family transcriptional regulator n=1 Tax=Segatella bryantii TaxID=77095 RepID=UPI00242EE429|nr:transcriptional repressor [Segatella bryantii]
MEESQYGNLLQLHGIKPTANRIIILRAIAVAKYPMSLKEIEEAIVTIDKSNISRTLALFRENHLVHDMEDGNGNVKYEVCFSHSEDSDDDEHVHFYCEGCRKIFCFEDTPIPQVQLPQGFEKNSINYMMKGLCPSCARKRALRSIKS